MQDRDRTGWCDLVFESDDGSRYRQRQQHAGRCVYCERLFAKHGDETVVVRIGAPKSSAGPVRGARRIPRGFSGIPTVHVVPGRARPCVEVNQLAVLGADGVPHQEQVRDAEELAARSDQGKRESCTM
jgi:hypothetical protein